MNYKEFEKVVMRLVWEEIEYNMKLWTHALDFMETWEPSEFTNKGEEDVLS